MSIIVTLAEAWVIGVAIAAPVGPIGLLCIKKTLELGIAGAIAVGLGAALADSVYGLIAGAGLTAVSIFLFGIMHYLKIFGGILLLTLGAKECLSHQQKAIIDMPKVNFFKMVLTTFMLTLSNPLTILSFAGVFTAIGSEHFSLDDTAWILIGVFLGSMSWWLFLGYIVCSSHKVLPKTWINKIRYISAFILIAFGAWALCNGLLEFITTE